MIRFRFSDAPTPRGPWERAAWRVFAGSAIVLAAAEVLRAVGAA